MQGKRGSNFPTSRDKKSIKTMKKETPMMKKPVVMDIDVATMKKSTKTTNKETPIKRERPGKKPVMVDLDDDDEEEAATVKKSKYASQPQVNNSFSFQSSGVSYANYLSSTTSTYVGVGGFYGSVTTTCVGGVFCGSTTTTTANTVFNDTIYSRGASRVSTSRAMGSNGYRYEEFKEADLSTREATHRVSRGIRNKGRSVTRKLKSDGYVDTVETLHNLNEDEVPDFKEEWTENAEKNLPAWNANRFKTSIKRRK